MQGMTKFNILVVRYLNKVDGRILTAMLSSSFIATSDMKNLFEAATPHYAPINQSRSSTDDHIGS